MLPLPLYKFLGWEYTRLIILKGDKHKYVTEWMPPLMTDIKRVIYQWWQFTKPTWSDCIRCTQMKVFHCLIRVHIGSGLSVPQFLRAPVEIFKINYNGWNRRVHKLFVFEIFRRLNSTLWTVVHELVSKMHHLLFQAQECSILWW